MQDLFLERHYGHVVSLFVLRLANVLVDWRHAGVPFLQVVRVEHLQLEPQPLHVLDELLDEDALKIYKKILKESQLANISIKKIKKIDELLEDNKILKNTLNIRNAYLDPLSLIQITLMKKLKIRKLNSVENNSLLLSVNGLAAGLRNTG